METERRIFRNTFVLTLGNGAGQLLNFALVVYLARAFGADTLGEFSFAVALGTLLSVFVSLGTNALALREIAHDPAVEGEIIGTLIPFQVLAGVALMIGIAVFGQVFSMGGSFYGMLLLMGLSRIVLRWTGLIMVRFRARELMAHAAAAEALRNLLRLVFGAVLIWLFMDPLIAFGVFPVSAIVVCAWLYVASVHRFGAVTLRFNPRRTMALIVAAWPYFSILVVGVLYERLGVILLRTLDSQTAVGYFASAERLVVAASLLHAMFVSAVFPAMTRLAADDEGAMTILAARCLRLLLVLTLPIATLLFLFSEDIIAVLFGADFRESAAVLKIVAWTFVIQGINGYFAVLAMAINDTDVLARTRFAAFVVFAVLAVVLIQMFSYIGLALAIVAAETMMMVTIYLVLRPKIHSLRIVGAAWKMLLACAIVLGAGILLSAESIVLRLSALPVILIVCMAAVRAVHLHDLQFLLRILRGVRNQGPSAS